MVVLNVKIFNRKTKNIGNYLFTLTANQNGMNIKFLEFTDFITFKKTTTKYYENLIQRELIYKKQRNISVQPEDPLIID